MKTYTLQRRLAAQLLGVGKNRVWLDPSRLKDIGDAITKADIAELIKEQAIKKLPVKGVKRRAGKMRQLRKKKRKRKAGKRKKIVRGRKRQYVYEIRKLRAYLRALKKQKVIDIKQYRMLRNAAKARIIRTKQDVMARIK